MNHENECNDLGLYLEMKLAAENCDNSEKCSSIPLSTLRSWQYQVGELQEENDKLLSKISDLKREVLANPQYAVMGKSLLETENSDLSREIKYLKSLLDNTKTGIDHRANKIERLEKEIDLLEYNNRCIKHNASMEGETKIADLERENKILISTNKGLYNENNVLHDTIENQNRRISELKKETKRLKDHHGMSDPRCEGCGKVLVPGNYRDTRCWSCSRVPKPLHEGEKCADCGKTLEKDEDPAMFYVCYACQ